MLEYLSIVMKILIAPKVKRIPFGFRAVTNRHPNGITIQKIKGIWYVVTFNELFPCIDLKTALVFFKGRCNAK